MTDTSPLPEPPYYAVIFLSQLKDEIPGYAEMSDAMEELALSQPGYLGADSARNAAGLGITVSYWRDEASIAAWKAVSRHLVAQRTGIDRWYEHYETRVARVERAYRGPAGRLAKRPQDA